MLDHMGAEEGCIAKFIQGADQGEKDAEQSESESGFSPSSERRPELEALA
jgi:hypothetical protein